MIERRAMAMKAMPASTSFPPLISQTIKATMAAGKMKKRIFTMTTMIIMPNTRRASNASKPIRPNEPKQSDTGNMAALRSNHSRTLKSFH